MRNWITTFVFLLLTGTTGTAFAQDTTYFDKFWKVSTPAHHTYYRVAKQKKSGNWEFLTYFSENNQLQRRAYFKSDKVEKGRLDPTEGVGKWTTWHSNGQKHEEFENIYGQLFTRNMWDSKGNPMVVNGDGESIYDSKYKGKRVVSIYKNGQLNGIQKEYQIGFKKLTLLMETEWENGIPNGIYRLYYTSGKLRREGQFADGMRAGTWKWWKPSGALLDTHTYSATSPDRYVDRDVLVEPVLTNRDEFYRLTGYPPIAREADIEGRVVISILVSTAGEILDSKVIEDPHPILTKAVLAKISHLEFTPGSLAEEPMKMWVTIPFTYELMK